MRHSVETELLCGITRALDEEEWPLLELEDVTISYNQPREKAGQLVDLFKVHLHGPFHVKGKLGKLKKDQESLALIDLSKLYKDYIFIPKVYTYSLEVKNDGKIIIWVLGNCGWYALSPAKEYQPIFEQMLEKTKIWLFLENKYVPSIYYRGKKKLKGTAQDVFIDFSKAYPDWPTAKAAAALFHKHHEWIILKMLVKEDEVDNWARTPLHTEIFTRYKSTVTEIKQLLELRNGQNSIVANISTPPAEDLNTIIVNPHHNPTDQSTAPIMISNPISQRRNLRRKPKVQAASTPPTPPFPPPSDDTMDDAEESSSSESEPEEQNPQNRRSTKGKSVLRPKTSTIIPERSSPLSARALTRTDNGEDMPDLDLFPDSDETNKHARKRTAATTDLGIDSDDPVTTPAERLKKRYRAIHAQPRPRSETPVPDPAVDWPPFLNGTGKPPIDIGHMPPTTSSRPGGAWMCSVPNCEYRLLDADSADGRTLIEAHYGTHARVMQDAMEIIGMEKQAARGIYHVDNLLAKIEQMANTWSHRRS